MVIAAMLSKLVFKEACRFAYRCSMSLYLGRQMLVDVRS